MNRRELYEWMNDKEIPQNFDMFFDTDAYGNFHLVIFKEKHDEEYYKWYFGM